jgi:hypothetical protein
MPETLILQIIRETGEMQVDALLNELHRQRYFNDAEAKAGIWRLISQAALELTDANTLRATAQHTATH